MEIQKESNSKNRSKSGSSDKESNVSGSRSDNGSGSGSSSSNSVSRTSSSKSTSSNSRSGSDNSGSGSGSKSRSSSSNSDSSKRSSSSSRSRSASASSRSSGEGNSETKPIPIEEEVKPIVGEEEAKPLEESKPTEEENKPIEDKPFEDKPNVKEDEKRNSSISSGSGSNSQSSSSASRSRSESTSSRSSGEEKEEEKPTENDETKPKEEVEEIKPIEKEDIEPKEENEINPTEVETKPKKKEESIEKEQLKEEPQLDKTIIDKYMEILNSLHNNYEKDINGLKMKIEDKTLIDYLTLIIKSNMMYSSYTDKINIIINKVTIVDNHININFIDEEIKSINKLKTEEQVIQSVENVKNHYLCLKDCHDLFIQLIESLLKDIDCTKQIGDLKLIENTITQWNNRNNNEYISIENYYDYIFKFMEYLSKIYLAEVPPPPIPNLDYDEYIFQVNEFVNIYHYQSKHYRLARIYSISNGIYTVKYLSESILKFRANLLYPVLKPHDNVIFHLPADSTPYDGMVVSNMHNNNYWILAKNRRRYYVPIDHLSTDRHYEIGSEVKVFYQDKYSNGVIISIDYDMRETYFMIRLYEENEDLLPDRLEKCKTILKINDN